MQICNSVAVLEKILRREDFFEMEFGRMKLLMCFLLSHFLQVSSQCQEGRLKSNEALRDGVTIRDPDPSTIFTNLDLRLQNFESLDNTTLNKYEQSRIEILRLSMNKIADILEGTFRGFRNLQKLYLDVNSLLKLRKIMFREISTVQELYLNENLISEIEPGTFQDIRDLLTIDLRNNCLVKLPPTMLFRNLHVRNIYLSDNFIEQIPSDIVPNGHFIENFNITRNRINSTHTIFKYNFIESLDLSENPLKVFPIIQISKENSSETSMESEDKSEVDDELNMLNTKFNSKRENSKNSIIKMDASDSNESGEKIDDEQLEKYCEKIVRSFRYQQKNDDRNQGSMLASNIDTIFDECRNRSETIQELLCYLNNSDGIVKTEDLVASIYYLNLNRDEIEILLVIEDFLDNRNSTILKSKLAEFQSRKIREVTKNVEELLNGSREVRSASSWTDRLIQALSSKNRIYKGTFLKAITYRLADFDTINMISSIEDYLKDRNTELFLSRYKMNFPYFQNPGKLIRLTHVLKMIFNNCSLSKRVTRRSVQYPERKTLLMKREVDFQKFIQHKLTNHLKYFTCRKCSIKNVDFLIKFPELIFVDFSYNSVEELNLDLLKALPDLKYVLLAYNKLFYINMQEILNTWKQLKYLDIKYNELRCSNVEGAKSVLRNLGRVFRMESGCR